MTEIAKLQKKLQEAGDATLPLSKGKGQTAACTFVLLGDKAEGWKNDSLTALLLLAGTGCFRAGQQKWQVAGLPCPGAATGPAGFRCFRPAGSRLPRGRQNRR